MSKKIVATILSNNTQEKIIYAVLSAMNHVDAFILVDSGITDNTINVVKTILDAFPPEKLIVESFPWQGDISKSRTFALEAAKRHGFDFAITLDTDERLEFLDGWREEIEASDLSVGLAHHKSGFYAKERVFKIPAIGGWRGATHETCIVEGLKVILKNITFWELSKTPEQYLERFEADLIGLEKTLSDYPNEARWHFYKGQTLYDLGRLEESIESYKKCIELSFWDEETGTSHYRAGYALYRLDRFAEAIKLCCEGMPKAPFMAELPWLSAESCFRMGRFRDAIFFAKMALTVGEVSERFPRFGFSYRWAYKDGPEVILSAAEGMMSCAK